MLKLLELQHQKLAQIVSSQKVRVAEDGDEAATLSVANPVSDTLHLAKETTPRAPEPARQDKTPQAAKISSRIGSQLRESSPSLARDIASRRGIPASGRNPTSAAAQARARQVSPEARRARSAAPIPKIPASIMDSQANLREAARRKTAEDDEGFAKFYSSLTTGTMSKLSSVLAYAGLPLTADDVQTEQAHQKRTVSASNEPDVQKYISKAALNAVEDHHRGRGTLGQGFAPNESFYVVPGTQSYADIAKAKHNELSGPDEEDNEAFVDAKERPAPSSPTLSRLAQQNRTAFDKTRTYEELELANKTYTDTIERLNHRLHDFEAHAQDASMMALTQSIVSLRPQGSSDVATHERLSQLEQQVEQHTVERQALQDRAAKQEKMLKKYQSKWEQIKTSAKERDKAKKEKAEKGVDDSAAGVPDIS